MSVTFTDVVGHKITATATNLVQIVGPSTEFMLTLPWSDAVNKSDSVTFYCINGSTGAALTTQKAAMPSVDPDVLTLNGVTPSINCQYKIVIKTTNASGTVLNKLTSQLLGIMT